MLLNYKLIAVTGTKGKTSVVRMLDFLFLKNKRKTLRVDTDGHFINGKQKSTFMDSRALYKLYPTVSPGRYLYEFENANRETHVGIFETSIGCARKAGMGYFRHHIGIFTNVFEDHIDDDRITSKADLLERKASFILQLFKNNHFIYNFDDELLYELRNTITKPLKLVAVSLNYEMDFLSNDLDKEQMVLTVKDNFVVKIQDGEIEEILDLNKFIDAPIKYKPFLYNVLFVVAAALAYGLKKDEINQIIIHKEISNNQCNLNLRIKLIS
jgi:UDP-N-acetylmuramyl tripeptide synthase